MFYIFLFIVFFVIELAYFRLANHFNIIDKPNDRSSHTRVTLRGGGIIFYVGVLFYFLLEGFQYPWFFIGLTLISLISFADDIQPQSKRLRISIHFTSMALMFYQWGLLAYPWYFALLALVICTGILNAYNFMDGINGITGGYSFVVIGALCYVNQMIVPFVDAKLIYCLILAVSVFNFFNFRKKAKCFAGDVGAISIAFSILFLLGLLIIKTGDFSYMILLVIYGIDTVLTIIHRLMLKESIVEAHRKHAYQLLANELKVPHVMVSILYALLQTVVVIGFFVFKEYSYLYFGIIVALLSIVYVLFKKKYFHLHLQAVKVKK
jgi:UDP-N-acetylmuramyl pentapeptide phosphotransferase/UDP-N-acetylglucosamine-1-phosphate transferase